MEEYKGAEAFIEVLNANGVEKIFFNPGIDTVPVQVTVSRFMEQGKPTPDLVLCLDESVAMHAAHGHYMVSGRPQVVLVHRELGTLQVGGALLNAQWGRIPTVLCAGSAATAGRMTWKQEPYDQGNMVRNCVKWDHEMHGGENIRDVALDPVSFPVLVQVGIVGFSLTGKTHPVVIARPGQIRQGAGGIVLVLGALVQVGVKEADGEGAGGHRREFAGQIVPLGGIPVAYPEDAGQGGPAPTHLTSRHFPRRENGY